jgi:hypothetical protein
MHPSDGHPPSYRRRRGRGERRKGRMIRLTVPPSPYCIAVHAGAGSLSPPALSHRTSFRARIVPMQRIPAQRASRGVFERHDRSDIDVQQVRLQARRYTAGDGGG